MYPPKLPNRCYSSSKNFLSCLKLGNIHSAAHISSIPCNVQIIGMQPCSSKLFFNECSYFLSTYIPNSKTHYRCAAEFIWYHSYRSEGIWVIWFQICLRNVQSQRICC